MPFINFKWPNREQIETAAKYWPHLLVTFVMGFFCISIYFLKIDNTETNKKVDAVQKQLFDYMMNDHTQMLQAINKNSDAIQANSDAIRNNRQAIEDLKYQRR